MGPPKAPEALALARGRERRYLVGLAPELPIDPVEAPLPAEVHAQIDWQGHPAMHIPWGFFFTKGLRDKQPHRTWKHQFKQIVTEPYLSESGVRIFLVAAMAAEAASKAPQAKAMILEQIAYVDDFAKAHADRYAVARSPEEARALLATTDKMVLVHSIEGGHLLLNDPKDAALWAEAGVALMTLIHLRDDELGGSAILEGALGPLVNPVGAKQRRRGERRGLTDRGRDAIVELADAGIIVDLSHMSHETTADALAVTKAHGIPPVLTHSSLRSIRDGDGGLTEDELVEVYAQGGLFALGLSAEKLTPLSPTRPVPEHCLGTLDTFRVHSQAVREVLVDRAQEIIDEPFNPGSEAHQTALAVGWSSDWNGWLSHSKPRHGPGRCLPVRDDPLAIDKLGLAHPGLLPEHWQRLSEDGLDLEPMLRSAERFLRLWEAARARR
jgi:microsomal dipeptidase-like Zn-dependent dipeptidase